MSIPTETFGIVAFLAPLVIVTAGVLTVLYVAHLILIRRAKDLAGESRLGRQVAMFALTGLGAALVVLSLPVPDSTKAQLLSILGLVLTAVLGVSSTTFVSNAMAGVMLHALGRFELGDFIKAQDYFGRITERGLFYTEIQTEDRDLITLPNLFLVTNPFQLIRSSGTVVSAVVTLGYDVHHERVRKLLLEAAAKSELTDPFVHILDLGDFAVKYRVAGLLSDVKRLLTVRSSLRRCMLDALHGDGVEIVSPSFMNQRALDPEIAVMPKQGRVTAEVVRQGQAETVVFDKADAAARIADLRKELEKSDSETEELEARRRTAEAADRDALDKEIEQRKRRSEWIRNAAANAEKELAKEKD